MHTRIALRVSGILMAWMVGAVARGATSFGEAEALAFTDRYCSSCHNDVDKEGGLDLSAMGFRPADPANFQTWVKVHDRVQAGEMPPKEKKRPAAKELGGFMSGLGATLETSERERVARD